MSATADTMVPAVKLLLLREWRGTVCAVCGSAKWADYPFCRSCSIRLQRVHLMKELKHRLLEALRPQRAESRVQRWLGHYDLCRDYLINRRREVEGECKRD